MHYSKNQIEKLLNLQQDFWRDFSKLVWKYIEKGKKIGFREDEMRGLLGEQTSTWGIDDRRAK